MKLKCVSALNKKKKNNSDMCTKIHGNERIWIKINFNYLLLIYFTFIIL